MATIINGGGDVDDEDGQEMSTICISDEGDDTTEEDSSEVK